MNGPGENGRERRGTERRDSPDARIQDAVDRIEQAARDLSASATDRAADYIEGVADRLSPKTRSRPARERATWPWSGLPRTPRLTRDRENGKLLGVCAGIANYYGLETWVVRLIALTGLVFLTSVTLIGYFVAALLMDPNPKRLPSLKPPRPRHPKHGKRKARRHTKDDKPAPYTWIPRQRLRDVRADFDQMELKLRRMEAHVTSGYYELHRELAELEKRDAGSPTNRSG
ncbi:MAG: PspC domain-containing protein [Gammaproteobacteria bacterium]|nr:PspC domain-containing protein [Gammaproteobacteria bacterium]